MGDIKCSCSDPKCSATVEVAKIPSGQIMILISWKTGQYQDKQVNVYLSRTDGNLFLEKLKAEMENE